MYSSTGWPKLRMPGLTSSLQSGLGGDAELEVQWTGMSLEKRSQQSEGRQSTGKSTVSHSQRKRQGLEVGFRGGHGFVRRYERPKMIRSKKSLGHDDRNLSRIQ